MDMLEKETGDENVMGRYGDKARNAEGHINYGGGFRDKNRNGCGEHVFQEEGRAHSDYKIGGRSTHVDYIIM